MLSQKSDEWATPQATFDALNREFRFTLDAAASSENAKCPRFFTQADNGLIQDWSGETVWCNPPYSQLAAWIRKAYEESRRGASVVLLIPARTDTRAWHDYIMPHATVRFIRGRLKFGTAKSSAPFPSAIVIFSPCPQDQLDHADSQDVPISASPGIAISTRTVSAATIGSANGGVVAVQAEDMTGTGSGYELKL